MNKVAMLTGLALCLAGAAMAQPPPYYPPPGGPPPGAYPPAAYPPIPPLRYEAVPPAPRGAFIWEPGHWHWNGAQYVWVAGNYVPRRHHRYAQYVPGQWQVRGGAWVWVPAHWR